MRIITILATFLCACGPAAMINETRVASAPSRASDCKLALLEIPPKVLSEGTWFTHLGSITVGQVGGHDPQSYKMRDIVAPRACKMGGDTLAIAIASENKGSFGRGAGTVYWVLKRNYDGLGVPGKSL